MEKNSLSAEETLEINRLRSKVAHLTEINRWKMELMWTLGHELRTPLTAIIGFTSLHLAGLYGNANPEQMESLHQVKKSGDAILQLLNNILDLSKLTVERMPIAKDRFNLTDFSKDILGSLESLVHSKQLYLSLDAPAEVWVQTDRMRLRQVIVNLIGNAIKFTDKGGVTVRLRPTESMDAIQIDVTDTGAGIKPEDLSKLFCEFTQLEGVEKSKRGAGLGLAICRKTMELLGGSVHVKSEVGLGSTFRLELPIGTPVVAATHLAIPQSALN